MIISSQCDVLLGNLGCWHSCGCHLTQITHPKTVVDHVHPLITTTLLDGRGPPAGQCSLTHHKHRLRNSLRNTVKGPRCWPGLQIPQIPDRATVGHAGAGLIHGGPPPQHTGPRASTIKRPGARHHRTPSEVLSPCLDRSELFWLHKGNRHHIRQVVIMLCLSCVCISYRSP